MSEILAALAGAATGVLGAYFFQVRSSRRERATALQDALQERQMRRSAVASALLIEVRTFEHHLRRFRRHLRPGTWRGESPELLFPHLAADLVSLNPQAVEKVCDFFGQMREVFAVQRIAFEKQAEADDTDDRHWHWVVRAKATFALEALAAAKEALIQQGGVLPGERNVTLYRYPQLPPKPERQFVTLYDEAEDEAD